MCRDRWGVEVGLPLERHLTSSAGDIQGVGIQPDLVKLECDAKASASMCLEGLV
jgi:hypothetical protein